MAGVIAAPKNGLLTVGVAWGASIYSVRVDSDVILTDVEAVKGGIRRVAEAGARIVSLAFGTTIIYSAISNEIEWNYYNRDILFFAAAGTSFCGNPVDFVMFPGILPTVTTVTALDNTGAIACNAHYGLAVDFAAFSGQPTTGWWNSGGPVGIAGSSNATALLSGIAALIVSARPSSTREQILADLTNAASPTGFRSNDIGWGAPNALCAVRGMCRVWVDGTALVEATGTYPFTARQGSSQGPFSYLWSTGETTATIQRQIDVTYSTVEHVIELQVTITDLSDGTQKSASRYVNVRKPNAACPECP